TPIPRQSGQRIGASLPPIPVTLMMPAFPQVGHEILIGLVTPGASTRLKTFSAIIPRNMFRRVSGTWYFHQISGSSVVSGFSSSFWGSAVTFHVYEPFPLLTRSILCLETFLLLSGLAIGFEPSRSHEPL